MIIKIYYLSVLGSLAFSFIVGYALGFMIDLSFIIFIAYIFFVIKNLKICFFYSKQVIAKNFTSSILYIK